METEDIDFKKAIEVIDWDFFFSRIHRENLLDRATRVDHETKEKNTKKKGNK